MKSKVFFLFCLTYVALCIRLGSAGYCQESYPCTRVCTYTSRFTESCNFWGGSCTAYRRATRQCTRTCYRQACCKGYDKDDCSIPLCYGSKTCPNGGTCKSPNVCECKQGYATPNCTDINECLDAETCDQTCTNFDGSYRCGCRRGYRLKEDNRTCVDINECAGRDKCDQTCINLQGTYRCRCRSGFKLNRDDHTCSDVDECESPSSNCSQICRNTIGSFVCQCKAGFDLHSDSRTCVDVDECESPSSNCSQICRNTIGSFVCLCKAGFDLHSDSRTCVVHGGFTAWAEWSECSHTCGGGRQTRTRTCTNPPPLLGGRNCDGPTWEDRNCSIQECPIDGGFSDWSEWSTCSKSCASGIKSRSRSCTNPPPQYGGQECSGNRIGNGSCNVDECPIDGGFSDWSEWTTCSASCGTGNRSRSMSCTNPSPQYGGRDCKGDRVENGSCVTQQCPIDGGFSDWSEWTTCSKSCGTGNRSRSRSCTNPPPQYGGRDCDGERKEYQDCNTNKCPIHGGFTEWIPWPKCSRSCDGGYQVRTRTCTNPAPMYGGDDCKGQLRQARGCSLNKCPVDGGYSDWTVWSNCSRLCGSGAQTRSRSCSNPAPGYGGLMCDGTNQESMACLSDQCLVCFPNRTIHLTNPDPAIYTQFKAVYDLGSMRTNCTTWSDMTKNNVYFDCDSTTATVTIYISDTAASYDFIVSGKARSYRYQCLDPSDFNTSVSRGIDVSINHTEEYFIPAFNITSGFYSSPDVEVTDARVGDIVYFVITGPSEYDIVPLECNATGAENDYVTVITDGCTNDPSLVSSFVVQNVDSRNGYNSTLYVFKFYSSDTLTLTCNVRVCVSSTCPISCYDYGEKKRSIHDTNKDKNHDAKTASISKRLKIIDAALGGSDVTKGSLALPLMMTILIELLKL